MGPSLLIGACLILALRTAKWSVRSAGNTTSDRDLEAEVEHAIQLAGRVMSVRSRLVLACFHRGGSLGSFRMKRMYRSEPAQFCVFFWCVKVLPRSSTWPKLTHIGLRIWSEQECISSPSMERYNARTKCHAVAAYSPASMRNLLSASR